MIESRYLLTDRTDLSRKETTGGQWGPVGVRRRRLKTAHPN
jgi:hypothetical protein